MKKVYLGLLLALGISSTVQAQTVATASQKGDTAPVKNIYLELGGPSSGLSFGFDSRLRGNHGWGYNVGVGVAVDNGHMLYAYRTTVAVTAPVMVNYLTGTGKHHFEAGLGAGLAWHHVKETVSDALDQQREVWTNRFGLSAVANIGYRFVSSRGFHFRVGATPILPLLHRSEMASTLYFSPYLSLGLAF